MDYKKHYDLLIDRAKGRILEGYKESHHIIPRCMGGRDDSSNLVDLTAREHYIAHLLLIKIYPKHYGIVKAAMMMSVCSSENQERCINNRTYGWLKELHSEVMSKSQKGEGNSQFGKMWICNLETKENKKIPKDEPIPNGWVIGRNAWNKIYEEKTCSGCGKIFTSKNMFCSRFCASSVTSKNNWTEQRKQEQSMYIMEQLKNGESTFFSSLKGVPKTKEHREKISKSLRLNKN